MFILVNFAFGVCFKKHHLTMIFFFFALKGTGFLYSEGEKKLHQNVIPASCIFITKNIYRKYSWKKNVSCTECQFK